MSRLVSKHRAHRRAALPVVLDDTLPARAILPSGKTSHEGEGDPSLSTRSAPQLHGEMNTPDPGMNGGETRQNT
jgi:hypothetical protein